MSDPLGTYFGEPISSLPREKLLQLIDHLLKQIERDRRLTDRDREVWKAYAMR